MEFPGFEPEVGSENTEGVSAEEEAESDDLSFDPESAEDYSEQDLTNLLSHKVGQLLSISEEIRKLLYVRMTRRIKSKSKQRWEQETDIHPYLLRGKSKEEAIQNLPEVHPEVKFLERNSPDNMFISKLLSEISRIARILQSNL